MLELDDRDAAEAESDEGLADACSADCTVPVVGVETGARDRRIADAPGQLAGAATRRHGHRHVAAGVARDGPNRVSALSQLLTFAVGDEDRWVGHLDSVLARKSGRAVGRKQHVPAVPHDGQSQIDRVTDVAEAGRPAGAPVPPVHDARVQLDHAVGVQARTDAGVEKRLVLHVAHRGDSCFEGATAHVFPARFERALDGGLPVGELGFRNRSGAAVDDEGRLGHSPQVKPSP